MAPIINYASAINDLAEQISNVAESKGFWDQDGLGDVGIVTTKIALIHSEASEVLEVHRREYDDSEEDMVTGMTEMQEYDFTEEVADIIIRALDLAGYYGLDIGESIIEKMAKNEGRPHRHGKRY